MMWGTKVLAFLRNRLSDGSSQLLSNYDVYISYDIFIIMKQIKRQYSNHYLLQDFLQIMMTIRISSLTDLLVYLNRL